MSGIPPEFWHTLEPDYAALVTSLDWDLATIRRAVWDETNKALLATKLAEPRPKLPKKPKVLSHPTRCYLVGPGGRDLLGLFAPIYAEELDWLYWFTRGYGPSRAAEYIEGLGRLQKPWQPVPDDAVEIIEDHLMHCRYVAFDGPKILVHQRTNALGVAVLTSLLAGRNIVHWRWLMG